jgi:hypothetical protein
VLRVHHAGLAAAVGVEHAEHVVDGLDHVPAADAQRLVRRLDAELVAVVGRALVVVVEPVEARQQAGPLRTTPPEVWLSTVPAVLGESLLLPCADPGARLRSGRNERPAARRVTASPPSLASGPNAFGISVERGPGAAEPAGRGWYAAVPERWMCRVFDAAAGAAGDHDDPEHGGEGDRADRQQSGGNALVHSAPSHRRNKGRMVGARVRRAERWMALAGDSQTACAGRSPEESWGATGPASEASPDQWQRHIAPPRNRHFAAAVPASKFQ